MDFGVGGLVDYGCGDPKGGVGKAASGGMVYSFKYKLFPSLRCLGCSVGGSPGVGA